MNMKKRMNKLRERLGGAWREDSGNVAIMVTLALPLLLLSIGGGADYARVLAARQKLQVAADSAALATYKHYALHPTISNNALKTYYATQLKASLQSKFEREINLKSVTLSVDKNAHRLNVAVKGDYPTTFIRLAGINRMPLNVQAEVHSGVSRRTEVALVLDVTGSMNENGKLDELKKAAKDFLEYVHAKLPAEKQAFKVAIVPFAQYVNVGKDKRHAWWLKDADDVVLTRPDTNCYTPCLKYIIKHRKVCWHKKIGDTGGEDPKPIYKKVCKYKDIKECVKRGARVCKPVIRKRTVPWDGCVGSRPDPYNITDKNYNAQKVPAVLRFSRKPTVPITDYYASFDWHKVNRCPNPITPLTTLKDHKTKLIGAVNHLKARGWTYIPGGLMWGWRVLSHQEPFAEGASDSDVKNKNVSKVIVLMTDGENTVAPRLDYWREHVVSSDAESRANDILKRVCNNIKKTNPATGRPYADIITITFDVTNNTIKKLLRDCSTMGSYDAKSGGLSKVFDDIAAKLVALHLSK